MFSDEDRINYINKTKEIFSNILRKVFGNQEGITCIKDKSEIQEYIKILETEFNKDIKVLNYIWWWRGCSNNSLGKFIFQDGYLYIDYKCMKIKSIYVYISVVPNFDLLMLEIEGEEKNNTKIEDYNWDNKFGEIDINKNSIRIERHQFYDKDEILHFKLSYNLIITAQFGIVNSKIISTNDLEINLNKLLFNQITFEEFVGWYTIILNKMEERIKRFHQYLVEYPMLGMKHEMGIEIMNRLDSLNRITIENTVFYRARKTESIEPYDEDGMWNPNPYKYQVLEGRYNHFGKSFLYLASNEETAFKEISNENDDKCCIAKFHIEKLKDVVDLRSVNFYDVNKRLEYVLMHYILVYTGVISESCTNENVKNEYLVSRFLSDCVRVRGYYAIIFNSTKSLEGENIVIFRPQDLRKLKYISMCGQAYIWYKNK